MIFSSFAFAEGSISKCDVNDEICTSLKEKYGDNSEVLYNASESETCKYKLEILDSDNNKRIVFVSELPQTIEDSQKTETVAPPPVLDNTNGTITDSGIVTKPGAMGIDEIYLPETSMDEILNWATTKGNEVIYLLQIFCQPFAIIIFIIAAFMTLIGCIGKSDMVGKGVWGMVLSVVVYAAVLYAPVILQAFVGWVAS
jgi:hypothetical protein